MKRARINLSLENDLLEWLEHQSTAARISVSAYVRQLVDAKKRQSDQQTLRETAHPLPLAPAATGAPAHVGAEIKRARYTIPSKH